ncbi:hypothetical protein GUITHDRAFT_109261 [Guillardia theta CCMP2712]|uniref:RWP-RK domain-containing protein n=1 Tax=Guillardia theta (strain CCMP2712) TaxID=905079 RepID=L1J8J4_GUITC|nr:hypothetical protein GUITHDRAFT_109261 [Guillardia theta CCMP2712]EKX44836.1 hypothetical protein GUITHDRAFT_109261 [Guillardia theta CCMP2712]|eukprot:XP_005831816.1 hypothetical protein GUITHDRAFT_109261 [Guillardia theta CCMP2712]
MEGRSILCRDPHTMTASSSSVLVYPRRKTLQGFLMLYKGARGVSLKASSLQALFHLPQTKAAASLGLSLTAFKSACRRLGIARWPYERKSRRERAEDEVKREGEQDDEHDREQEKEQNCMEENQQDGDEPLEPEWIDWYMSASESEGTGLPWEGGA